jgi:hypothetical protein
MFMLNEASVTVPKTVTEAGQGKVVLLASGNAIFRNLVAGFRSITA